MAALGPPGARWGQTVLGTLPSQLRNSTVAGAPPPQGSGTSAVHQTADSQDELLIRQALGNLPSLPVLPCKFPAAALLRQVMTHPVTLAYLALSGLAGLATTYYYNNPGGWQCGPATGLRRSCLRRAVSPCKLTGLAQLGAGVHAWHTSTDPVHAVFLACSCRTLTTLQPEPPRQFGLPKRSLNLCNTSHNQLSPNTVQPPSPQRIASSTPCCAWRCSWWASPRSTSGKPMHLSESACAKASACVWGSRQPFVSTRLQYHVNKCPCAGQPAAPYA